MQICNGAGGLRNHICFVTFESEIPGGIPAVLTERAHERSNHKSVNLAGGAEAARSRHSSRILG
jgi:hypothetical protein